MSKRRRNPNRPGRMMPREVRAAERDAVARLHDALGPAEILRRADVVALGGISSSAADIAEVWLDERADPGWGVYLDVCARQFYRLTGRELTDATARDAIDAREDADEMAREEDWYRQHGYDY